MRFADSLWPECESCRPAEELWERRGKREAEEEMGWVADVFEIGADEKGPLPLGQVERREWSQRWTILDYSPQDQPYSFQRAWQRFIPCSCDNSSLRFLSRDSFAGTDTASAGYRDFGCEVEEDFEGKEWTGGDWTAILLALHEAHGAHRASPSKT